MLKTSRRCLKADLVRNAEEEKARETVKKAKAKRKEKEGEQLTKALHDHYAKRTADIDSYLHKQVKAKKQQQKAVLKGTLMKLADQGHNQPSATESEDGETNLMSKRRKINHKADQEVDEFVKTFTSTKAASTKR